MKHRLTLALATVVARVHRSRRWCRRRRRPRSRSAVTRSAASCSRHPGRTPRACRSRSRPGTRPALKALIGASQNEVFSLGSGTRVHDLVARRPARRDDGRSPAGRLGDSPRPGRTRLVAAADRKPAGRCGRRVGRTERRPAVVALRRHRLRTAVRRPHRAARDERQLESTPVDARPVARPVVHLRRRHDLPDVAGPRADGHRPVAASGRRPHHRAHPRTAQRNARARSRRSRPRTSAITSRHPHPRHSPDRPRAGGV